MREKNKGCSVLFADIFCGDGMNVIDGQEINGSPISMLEGLVGALLSMKGAPSSKYRCLFADISEGRATDFLPQRVRTWADSKGLELSDDCTKLLIPLKGKDGNILKEKAEVLLTFAQASAVETVNWISSVLRRRDKRRRACIFVDPNGPKHAPWEELRNLWDQHKRKVEITAHISATQLKRIKGAREVGKAMPQVPDHVSAMIGAFKGAGGWIRSPAGADQWTVAMLTMFQPRSDWKKAGFVAIDSEEGADTIRRLSLTAKEYNKCTK